MAEEGWKGLTTTALGFKDRDDFMGYFMPLFEQFAENWASGVLPEGVSLFHQTLPRLIQFARKARDGGAAEAEAYDQRWLNLLS